MLIVCGKCQSTVRVPDDSTARKGRCPQCGSVIDIPSAETAYAAEPPPPPLPATPPPLPAPSRRDDLDDEPRRRRSERRSERDDDDDRFDRSLSIRLRGRGSQSIGLSVTGMVMGLAALFFLIGSIAVSTLVPAIAQDAGVCCFSVFGGYTGLIVSGIVAILGTIFSFVGMRHGGLWYAWTGAISSLLTLIVVILLIVLTVLFGVVVFMGLVLAVGAAANAANPPPPGGPPMRRR